MRVKNFIPFLISLIFFLSAGKQILAQNPVVSQAVNFKVSVPVRDLKAMNVTGKGVQIDQEEINEKNRAPIRTIDPNAKSTPDAALSSATVNPNGITPQVPNPPTVSFDGISFTESTCSCLPPDVNGEVGPNNFVQSVNVAFRVWDKVGNPLTPVTLFSSLFAPLGPPCGTSNDGDPIVIYDQLADRWLISQFCTVANPNNHQLIAISKTGDPAGAYYLYDFMMPNNKFNDYPKFGMWPDAYYMTDNQFNQAGTAFLGAGVFAFNRAKMLVGDPTASFIYFDVFAIDPSIGGMLPSDLDGLTPPVAGTPNTFAYFTANEFGDPSDAIRLFDFHADFAVPANSTFTERTGSPLVVAAFDPRTVPNSSNVVPQPAPATSGSFLDAIGDRLMFRLSYRNFGSSESLILNHTVNAAVNPAYRAGVRFYQLNRATPAAAFTIAEQQTFAPAGTENRWMGSGSINHQGDIAVGYSVSSSTVFPSIKYAAKLGTDPAGSGLFQGEQSIVAGAGSQTSSSGRWGDYSDITVDPSDDCTFWYTQEYYSASGLAIWKTRIAKFSPGTCTSSPRGTINGTITNCLTGLPIPLAFVSITGGYSRATLANGTYSATVPPGTYNVSATAPGYDVASATGLVVTNGGTVTFNACLNGNLIQPVADIGTVTADDCNSNGLIDPNENITVSLGIKNTGTLNSVNLVATLQATGGVISPGGPQNYGVVVAGGPTIFRSFTFTAGNVLCGSTVVVTLQLQDGATNLGTISYNFVTGNIVVNNYSTGNIAVPIPDSPAPAINIPITVADVMTLTDVNVSFRINHTFDGDLRISLVHPDNTVVPLVTNRGSSGQNFGNGANDCSGTPTFMDDQASTAIAAGTAPFAGSYIPESPLSALNGKPSNGTWNLRVQDVASLDVGTVFCIKLELNKRVVCCGAQIVAAPPVVLTAESCFPTNNAVDPGETVTVNLCVQNVGGSNTTNLVGTLQNTGGVTAASGPQTYGVVVGSGPSVCRPFTFTASGTCGNTITLTLNLQDGATNLGTVTYTMQLGTTITAMQTFSNPAAITIPATGTGATTGAPATPYPSNITVAGIVNPVTKVTVTLKQLSHTFPSDVDVLLVGPTGQKFIVMSDVIGGTDWTGQTYTFDDAAPTILPSSGAPPASGSFKPTNYGTGDLFPAPAPVGPFQDPATAGTATFASVFNGLIPNGTWSLYVVDDAGTDIGIMAGGWDLSVTTAIPTCCSGAACTVNCPANITVPNDPNQCGAVVNYPAPTTSGTCGIVTASPASGSFFPVGTTTVTATSSIGGGTCTFTITVNDAQAPTITCPANITVSNNPNQCGAVVNYPAPTVSDNCPGVSFVSSPASGSFFPVGTTTVTATATDASGNTASCTFTVTVNDTQPPTITCPANIIVSNNPNQCGAVVNYPAPAFSDNCPGVTVVASPASGSFFPVGTTTVTATATDAAGNTATCTFTVTVNDTQPPTITCPVPVTVSCAAAVPPVNIGSVTVSDNCPGVVVTHISDVITAQTCANRYTLTRTYRATDAAGNTAQCTQIITVNDITPPTLTCPAPVTVSCASLVPAPNIASVTGVSDNCAGVVTVTFISDVISAQTCANRYTITRTYRATDVCGNFAQCTQIITVNDVTAPVITCPANITVNNTPGLCSAVVTFTTTATDNCAGVVTIVSVPASGSVFRVGTTIVTSTATDVCGNSSTCTFTVTVVDNEPPVITCPANITTNNTPGLCSAVVNYPLPTATDNCCLPGAVSLTQTASQTPTAGSVACNAGGFHTNNSYWRAYNLASICLAGPLTINSVQFGIELADANGTGTTQPVTVRVYISAGAFPGGVRTLVASQVYNIPDQTLSVFNAVLTTPPTVLANSILVLELFTPDGRAPANNRFFIGSNTSAQTGPSYISAADCGIVNPTDLASIGFPNMHIILNANGITSGPNPITQIAGLPSGSAFPVGVTTNTFRATDAAGNTSTCSFTVTVVDNQAPSITCPANIVANTNAGVCTATVATPNPTTSDNCAVTTVTWVMTGATTGSSPATGINYVGTRAFNLNGTTGQGVTTITYSVKDAAGNTATCSFTVTVNDIAIPVIGGQPANQTVCVGTDAVFSVTATVPAGNPLTYQWQAWNGSSWVNIAGANASTLTLNAVTFSMNTNSYRVIVTGLCSVVTSAFATLYVNQLPTISLLASGPLALLPAQSVTLTAVVNPGGGSYQWFKNGVAIAGATGASLAGLTVDDIGTYRCRYTDLNGCVATSADMVVSGQTSDNLYVYPNPNTGNFQVRFYNTVNEPVTVIIFDFKGSKVYSKAVVTNLPYTEISVDLSNMPAGTYLVEVINSAGKIIGAKKVSKQN